MRVSSQRAHLLDRPGARLEYGARLRLTIAESAPRILAVHPLCASMSDKATPLRRRSLITSRRPAATARCSGIVPTGKHARRAKTARRRPMTVALDVPGQERAPVRGRGFNPYQLPALDRWAVFNTLPRN